LLTLLEAGSDAPLDAIVQVLAAHRFPLALAERPLRSLSPGERLRAALICVLRRRPVVDVLVLDEPTAGLDLVGEAALTAALKAWKGGLLVASHDLEFLRGVGVDRWVTLGA
jgi:ATPase subunit of ABC transporter with duplicated ATPase domains